MLVSIATESIVLTDEYCFPMYLNSRSGVVPVNRVDDLLAGRGDEDGSLAGKRVVGPVIEVERAARFAAVGAVDRDPESGLGREPRLPRSGGLYLDGAGACVAGDEDFAADAFRADSRLRFILAASPPRAIGPRRRRRRSG